MEVLISISSIGHKKIFSFLVILSIKLPNILHCYFAKNTEILVQASFISELTKERIA